MKIRFMATAAATLWFAGLTFAQHADIEVETMNGRLVTHPRVGEGEFGEGLNPANLADDPGFGVHHGTFQAEQQLHFNAIDILGSNLWFWDGVGDVASRESDGATIEDVDTCVQVHGGLLAAGSP